jgi:hypothetical protein
MTNSKTRIEEDLSSQGQIKNEINRTTRLIPAEGKLNAVYDLIKEFYSHNLTGLDLSVTSTSATIWIILPALLPSLKCG